MDNVSVRSFKKKKEDKIKNIAGPKKLLENTLRSFCILSNEKDENKRRLMSYHFSSRILLATTSIGSVNLSQL